MNMYSTQYLVGAPFVWITASMRRGMESISLWHCSGTQALTLSVVQEWLDPRNATAETHVLHTSVRSGSWSTDSSCSPLFVNLPHIFEWVLFHNPLQGAVIPIAYTLFFYGISEINQLFDDILIIWPAPVYICLLGCQQL